jgi:hypothetical protein
MFPRDVPCDEYAPPAEAFLLQAGAYDGGLPFPLCLFHRAMARSGHITLRIDTSAQAAQSPSWGEDRFWEAIAAWREEHNGAVPRVRHFARDPDLPGEKLFYQMFGSIHNFLAAGRKKGLWTRADEDLTLGGYSYDAEKRFSGDRFWARIAAWVNANNGRVPPREAYGEENDMPSHSLARRRYHDMDGLFAEGIGRKVWTAEAVEEYKREMAMRIHASGRTLRRVMLANMVGGDA